MKKPFILFACCLFIQAACWPVKAADSEETCLRLISPVRGILLRITDKESDWEKEIVMNETEEEITFPAGHTALIEAEQLPPGWAAGSEMKYPVGREEERIELPLHPFSLAFQLSGPDMCEADGFQIELYDEAGSRLAAWWNSVHEKTVFHDLKAPCGSRLRIHYTAVPDGFHLPDDQVFTVPETIADEEFIIVSEALPYAVRKIRYEPENTEQIITFYRNDEDEEACLDEFGEKAVYEPAEDGTFEANLTHGNYFINAETTPDGYYPLKRKAFLFDLYSDEELVICQQPIRIHVQIACEDGSSPGEIPVYVYHDDSFLQEEVIHEEGVISGEELKSGMEITIVPETMDGYEWLESAQSIRIPETAPEEDLIVRFSCAKTAGQPYPHGPSEASVEEGKKEEEEDKPVEKEEARPVYRGYEASVLRRTEPETTPAEASPVRSFCVVLQDEKGHPLSGAVLRVDNAEGETIAQWVSSNDAKRISEHVEPGETYLISQQTAVSGYEKMELRISFTMPKDAQSEPIITIKNKAAEKAVPIRSEKDGSLFWVVIPAVLSAALLAVWYFLQKKKKGMKQVS
ncbi:MAG: hypothetical protein IJH14_07095 [Solobacterium sp.]|nr:hypothetical protein [Solobacterium sp.]